MTVELPKFELLKFDLPKVEVPEACREFAEKSIAQVKDGYEKMRTAAEESTDALVKSYAKGTDGAREFGLKLIADARANSNAFMDLMGEVMAAKSYSQVAELSAGFMRQQLETASEQAKGLVELAQNAVAQTSEPVKEHMASVLGKAA